MIAASVGVSVTSLLQAKAVVEAGDSEPSRYGCLVEALDPRCVEAVRVLQARFDQAGAASPAPQTARPEGETAPPEPPPAPTPSKRTRGLSKRQRDILLQGNLVHCRRHASERDVDLYYREIYELEFGQMLPSGPSEQNGNGASTHDEQVKTNGKHYQSVVASIGRSARNLEERGLVRRVKGAHSRPAGVLLTETGRAVAEELELLGDGLRPLQHPLGVGVQVVRNGSE
jgi:hypothetical protein